MGVFRMMSVGRSGVGKSTIGNMFLFGKGEGEGENVFPISFSDASCTHDVKELTNKDGNCAYIDVPGIPDTDSNNTAKFYDVVIEEAKKDLNIILFVFKRDRTDPAAYNLAELLFRELNKANAMKILVINDHNNYQFQNPPTEEDYKGQIKTIENMTKIDFTHHVIFTGESMKRKLQELKRFIFKTESHKSESMKTFNELKLYVEVLREKKGYEDEVKMLKEKRANHIRKQIMVLRVILGSSSVGAAAGFIGSFSCRYMLPAAIGQTLGAGIALSIINEKVVELERVIGNIEAEDNMDASRELKNACKKFDELKAALDAN